MIDFDRLQQQPEKAADAIAAAILANNGSLAPAYSAFEATMKQMQAAGIPPEALLPDAARFGFLGRKQKDGMSFWRAYSEVVGENLCSPKSELRRMCGAGLSTGAGALVGTIVAALALPAAAVGIAVGIAGIVAAMGIDAFCRSTVSDHGSARTS